MMADCFARGEINLNVSLSLSLSLQITLVEGPVLIWAKIYVWDNSTYLRTHMDENSILFYSIV